MLHASEVFSRAPVMRKKLFAQPTKASILRSVNGAWVPTAEEVGNESNSSYVSSNPNTYYLSTNATRKK